MPSKRDLLRSQPPVAQPPPASWEDVMEPPAPTQIPERPTPSPEPPREELETVACRMTRAEKEALLELADANDVPPSYLARWFIVDGIRAVQAAERMLPERFGPARLHRKNRKRAETGNNGKR